MEYLIRERLLLCRSWPDMYSCQTSVHWSSRVMGWCNLVAMLPVPPPLVSPVFCVTWWNCNDETFSKDERCWRQNTCCNFKSKIEKEKKRSKIAHLFLLHAYISYNNWPQCELNSLLCIYPTVHYLSWHLICLEPTLFGISHYPSCSKQMHLLQKCAQIPR